MEGQPNGPPMKKPSPSLLIHHFNRHTQTWMWPTVQNMWRPEPEQRLTKRCGGTNHSQHSGPGTRRHVVFGVDSAHTTKCASLEDVDLPIQQPAVQLDAGAQKVIKVAAVLARLEDPEVAK